LEEEDALREAVKKYVVLLGKALGKSSFLLLFFPFSSIQGMANIFFSAFYCLMDSYSCYFLLLKVWQRKLEADLEL
jgi:hypothetical protein